MQEQNMAVKEVQKEEVQSDDELEESINLFDPELGLESASD